MMKKVLIINIIVLLLIFILYLFNIIPHISFSSSHFNIDVYMSSIDNDNDGIDDQTDILDGAKKYIKNRPKYKSKYYANGYPDDNYGTCTDVVAFALLNAGYDLRELVNEDVLNNRNIYDIDIVDKNIDFRRVLNLNTFFQNNFISLSTNIDDIESFQGGDIVVFDKHIAIVSDKRNYKGYPFIIHHSSPNQIWYEEDVIKRYHIIGHYRIS